MNLKNKNGTRWGGVVEGLVGSWGEVAPTCAFNRKLYIILKEIDLNNFI